MRGKVTPIFSQFGDDRITPAYAGKSFQMLVLLLHRQDHPRLCGEKAPVRLLASLPSGSPPPMRGKAEKGGLILRGGRITPAYAGKRQNVWRKSPEPRDHPRLCGEKCPFRDFWWIGVGSPPPMRGKVRCVIPEREEIRITPAYAGKRSLLHEKVQMA